MYWLKRGEWLVADGKIFHWERVIKNEEATSFCKISLQHPLASSIGYLLSSLICFYFIISVYLGVFGWLWFVVTNFAIIKLFTGLVYYAIYIFVANLIIKIFDGV